MAQGEVRRAQGTRRIGCALHSVAVLLLLTMGVVRAQTPAGALAIQGRVVAAATDTPIRMAHVLVYGAATRRLRATTTDADGRFEVAGLPPDTYRVGVSRPPFLAAIVDVAGPDLLFRLERGAAISGEVVTDLGRPEANIRIVALSNSGHAGGRAVTDTRGRYRIHGLTRGEYEVAAAGMTYGQPFTIGTGEDRQGVNFTITSPADETTQPPPTGQGRLAGRVIDPAGRHPLAATGVRLTGPVSRDARTDAQGRFDVPSLPPGTYSLRVTGPGAAAIGSAVVEIGREPITDIDLYASSLGTLSGTVRDDAGSPVVGVAVTAFLQTTLAGRPLLLPSRTGLTDDRGQYRIGELPRGEYRVCACGGFLPLVDADLLNELAPAPISPGQIAAALDAGSLIMPPAYHPGVRRATDAMVVSVGGDDRAGIDITVPITAGWTVSGRLAGTPGGQATDMAVRLVALDDIPNASGIAEIAAVTPVSPDGRFTITHIPPGSYAVVAVPRGSPGGGSGSVELVVDRDVSGLVVPILPGAVVHGRVDFGPGVGQPSQDELARTRITLSPAELTPVQMPAPGPAFRQAWLRPDGSFEITGVPPGRFRVTADGPGLAWHAIAQVATSSGIAPDHMLAVEGGSLSRIVVTMSSEPPASLEGRITLAKYEPPESLRVVAFTSAWRTSVDLLRPSTGFGTQPVGAGGTFRFPTLEAGDYFVVVVPGHELLGATARFAEWEFLAQRVTLRAGETTTVELRR